MRGAVLYGPRDVRFEEREVPKIMKPTDAIVRISATCVCGSDLWPYRGISAVPQPTPMGHEYCGIIEKVGSGVKSVKPGQFVIGSFFASDNTCPNCHVGYPVILPEPRVRQHRTGSSAARAACGRHACSNAGCSFGRASPEPANTLRCDGYGMVRGRCGEREAGLDCSDRW